MRHVLVCIGLALFVLGGFSSQASAAALDDSLSLVSPRVREMAFCATMKDRAPIGVADTLPADISRVFCFTRIVGAEDTTSVTHVWYYGDRKMAEVELPVRSSNWRTWSSKRVLPSWKGEWRVEVIAADSTVIHKKSFFLK